MSQSIPCPHCHKPLAIRDLQKRIGQLGGRPKSEDRCPCGAMTLDRAEKRGHKCGLRESTELATPSAALAAARSGQSSTVQLKTARPTAHS